MASQQVSPLKLLTLGYSVIPSGGGESGKSPLVNWTEYQKRIPTEAELEKWETEFCPALWGIVTGAISKVFIIDIDKPEQKPLMDNAGLEPHIKTPKGWHYWMIHPGAPVTIKTVAGLLPGVDVRGDGGFVNVLGTRKDGGEYHVLIVPTPDTLYKWDKLPSGIKGPLRDSGRKPATSTTPAIIAEGKRNHHLTSLAGSMRHRGMSIEAIEVALLQENQARCNPPLGDDEVKSIIRSISRYTPSAPTVIRSPKLSTPPTTMPNPVNTAIAMDKPPTADKSVGDGSGEPAFEETLPVIIITNRYLKEKSQDALSALISANKPPRLFVRGGALCRIVVDEKGQPVISGLNEHAFRGELERSAAYMCVNSKGEMMPVSPPLDIVHDVMNLESWDLPPLLGITEMPTVRPDGTILDTPGYDSITKLYYIPCKGLNQPTIPDSPTGPQKQEALQLLLDIIIDFPFDSESSRTNALAAIITPALRPVIDGPVPLAIFDKPQVGTGASLLGEIISVIATGRAAAMMTAPVDDESWRKTITSLLWQGRTVVIIDNVERTLYSAGLAAVLTASTYRDRILGRNETLDLPNRTTWIATGNNVQLGGDLPRRIYLIRMDPGMARPWLRDPKQFKHPEIIKWVSDNRGNIIAAILTLARAWVCAGKPSYDNLPNLGGYESWTFTIGNILAFAGAQQFLGNLTDMYDRADAETPQWDMFFSAWYEIWADEPKTTADIAYEVSNNTDFASVVPDNVETSKRGKDDKGFTRRLGKALATREGRRYPSGVMIKKHGEKKRAITWQVVSFEEKKFTSNSNVRSEFSEFETHPAREENKENKEEGNINSPNSLFKANSKLNGKLTPKTTTELPDCPACGRNEWEAGKENYICPCGHTIPIEGATNADRR